MQPFGVPVHINQIEPVHKVAFPTVPWFYTPPFYPDTGELRWQDRLQKMREAQSPYRLVALAPPEWDVVALQVEKPDYVVISDFEEHDVKRIGRADYRAFLAVLRCDYRLVRQFRNDPLSARPCRQPSTRPALHLPRRSGLCSKRFAGYG